MVSSVTATTVNGDTANGVVVIVDAGVVSAVSAGLAVAVGTAVDALVDGAVTGVWTLVELSPQLLISATAAHAAMKLRARRITTSS